MRELSRLLETPLSVVQKAVRSLERDGLVTGRMIGRTRLLELNSGYVALPGLQGFLAELAQPGEGLEAVGTRGHPRPRRKKRFPMERGVKADRQGRSRVEERPGDVSEKWRVW
jgi:hypothetical protein